MTLTDITGMLNNHMRLCSIDGCRCRSIDMATNDTQSQLGNVEILGATKDIKLNQSLYIQMKYKGLDKKICEILNITLRNLKNRNNVTAREIIQGYINHCMLNRGFTALYNIMIAEENNVNFLEEYQIFCLRFVYH